MVNKIKVRCTHIGDYADCLTLGMTYEVFEEKDYFYRIRCDSDEEFFFPKHFFEIVEDDNKEDKIENSAYKIKSYRENKKMKKSELAKIIGVSPAYIGMLENGKKENPSNEIKFKLSKALGVNIRDIFGEGNYYLFEKLSLGKEQEREIEKKMKLIDILTIVNTSQVIKIENCNTNELFYPTYRELKNYEEYEVVQVESKDNTLEIVIKPSLI